MGLHVLSGCEQCTERFNYNPPCTRDLNGRFRIVLNLASAIGNGIAPDCPFVASAKEIMGWVKSKESSAQLRAQDWASQAIQEMRGLLASNPNISHAYLGIAEAVQSKEGNFCVFYSGKCTSNRQAVFMRPMTNMANHLQWFNANGLQLPKDKRSKQQAQQNTVSDKRKSTYWPPPPSTATASGTFVHWDQLQNTVHQPSRSPDDFINWAAVDRGWQNGRGTLGGVYVAASDNQVNAVATGCHNVEIALGNALSREYLLPALKKKMPAHWVPVGLEVATGLVVQVGIMAGAVVIGAGLGAIASYFFAPGITTGAFAVAGGTIALAFANYLMQGLFLKDIGQAVSEQGKKLEEGIAKAWHAFVEEASRILADVMAALILAVLVALLMKLAHHAIHLGQTRLRNSKFAKAWSEEEMAKREQEFANKEIAAAKAHPKLPQGIALDSTARRSLPEFEQGMRGILQEATAEETLADQAAKGTPAESQHRLNALQKWIQANWIFNWQRSMIGHAKCVEAIVAWISDKILPGIRDLGCDPARVTKWFAELKVPLDPEEAKFLCVIARRVQSYKVPWHDYVGKGNKGMWNIMRGMSFPGVVAPEEFVKALGSILRRARKQPVETTNSQFQALLEKFPKMKKFYEQGNFDGLNRALDGRQAIIKHNVQPHHWATIPLQYLKIWIEQGADIFHSKIMVERGYQQRILGIDEDVKFYKEDGFDIKAVVKLAQFALRHYLNTGGNPISREQFARSSLLSGYKASDIWEFAPAQASAATPTH
ncbi:MAG TPA: hypothetical protein VMH05_08975 [Bryobacteraceae bacterium]|nr:hypothetical protein [Bryobacteraceae bacterium]